VGKRGTSPQTREGDLSLENSGILRGKGNDGGERKKDKGGSGTRRSSGGSKRNRPDHSNIKKEKVPGEREGVSAYRRAEKKKRTADVGRPFWYPLTGPSGDESTCFLLGVPASFGREGGTRLGAEYG